MTEFEQARLANAMQMFATAEWHKPMSVAGLLYHEVVRLREREAFLGTAIKIAQNALEYELNKSFWARLKDLFERRNYGPTTISLNSSGEFRT